MFLIRVWMWSSMEFKTLIKDFFSNKIYTKRLVIILLVLLFSFIIFLMFNLFKIYIESIRKTDDVKLYYEFGPNTVKYAFDEQSATSDISEQFRSYGISYGIDVSEWQGNIDWIKVKATGISFAIIRCGFRQIEGSDIIEDANFKTNIEGAINAGLKVGVYFYGTAKNEKEALEEAEFTINLIKDYNLSYPVVYDTESFGTGRLKNVDYSTLTDVALIYTETVGSYGYETMVYSYYNAFSYMLDTGKLEGKLIWLAHFSDRTDYKGNYDMWQYSSQGRVDGIKTNVDLNISYFNYVDEESSILPNPKYKTPPDVHFSDVIETVKLKTKAIYRTSPTEDMPNKLGYIKRGEIVKRTGISSKFSRIIYNDREAYVLNGDLSPVD